MSEAWELAIFRKDNASLTFELLYHPEEGIPISSGMRSNGVSEMNGEKWNSVNYEPASVQCANFEHTL